MVHLKGVALRPNVMKVTLKHWVLSIDSFFYAYWISKAIDNVDAIDDVDTGTSNIVDSLNDVDTFDDVHTVDTFDYVDTIDSIEKKNRPMDMYESTIGPMAHCDMVLPSFSLLTTSLIILSFF